tara:strand:+ start:658 stop:924 length:267 start_codon:yes stop_codon:yes gene_type:complete
MELLEQGVIPLLILTIYTTIDKILAPLIKKAFSNGSKGTGNQGPYGTLTHRLDRVEEDVHELRDTASVFREKIGIANAILERVEKSIK